MGVDDVQLLCSAIRDTQLYVANILGEAGTVIEQRIRTLKTRTLASGHARGTCARPGSQNLLISRAFGWARQDSNLDLTDYESAALTD